MNPICIAPQTALALGQIGLLRTAVDLQMDYVSLRLMPGMEGDPTPDLSKAPSVRREVKAMLADIRPTLLDVEVIRVTTEFTTDSIRRLLDIAHELGARRVVVSGNDPIRSRLEQNLALSANLAADRNISLAIEHASYMSLRTISDVLDLIQELALNDATVLTDPLQLARVEGTAADIVAVDRKYFAYADFCDAPLAHPGLDAVMNEARANRLDPGEGGLPLAAFVAALPPGTPLRLEVPRQGNPAGLVERVGRTVASARAFLSP